MSNPLRQELLQLSSSSRYSLLPSRRVFVRLSYVSASQLGLTTHRLVDSAEDAVVALVAPVRTAMMWDLTDAVCARDTAKALVALSEIDMARGAELPVLGAIAGSVRKLARFQAAVEAGDSPAEAAEKAGLPPFKASSMSQTVRRMPRGTMGRWLHLLAETDLALKGQGRRGGRAILEGMVLSMCR